MDRIFSILNGIQVAIASMMKVGDRVKNINTECAHYGSEGVIEDIQQLPYDMGYIVSYKTTNSGPTWEANQTLRKTKDQLALSLNDTEAEENNTTEEFDEYKNDLMGMSLSSLKAIKTHVDAILNQVESNESVRKNLTETWLQGKIAVVDDQLRSIHDFVMYADENDDTSDAGSKPGLWENIRKKKEREGKDYKPAKRGDPDRPDPKQWKKLTKKQKDKDKK
jgi:hypothetical protein